MILVAFVTEGQTTAMTTLLLLGMQLSALDSGMLRSSNSLESECFSLLDDSFLCNAKFSML